MFNIVTRSFRYLLHYIEHSRNDLLQEFCLFADDFVCDLVREKGDALQPIQQG